MFKHLKAVDLRPKLYKIICVCILICIGLLLPISCMSEHADQYNPQVVRDGLDAANYIVAKELRARDLDEEWGLKEIHFNVKRLNKVSRGCIWVRNGRVSRVSYISPDFLGTDGFEFKFIGGAADEANGDAQKMLAMIKALLKIDLKKYDDYEITSINAYIKKDGIYHTARLSLGATGDVSDFLLVSQAQGKILSMQERYSDYVVFSIQDTESKPASSERPKDPSAALLWSKEQVEVGNLEAMVYLATCFHDGCGVPEDIEEATRLYRQAMDGNSKEAMGLLGIYLLSGSNNESVTWFSDSSFFSGSVSNFPIDIFIEIDADGTVSAEGMSFSETEENLGEFGDLIKGMGKIGISQKVETMANILPNKQAPHVQILNVLDICTSVEGISVNLLCRQSQSNVAETKREAAKSLN